MDKGNIVKKYSNGEITVVWKPAICIHSAICFRSLPQVFDPRRRPWITLEASSTEQIIQQVNACPSGALSFIKQNETAENQLEVAAETKLEAVPNGPLLVYGNVHIRDAKGNETHKNKVTAFCRCGQSGNKPFCDGSHIAAKFTD